MIDRSKPHLTLHNLEWYHDDVIKWKHFPRNWPFVRGIHRSPVNSPHKGQWRGALMFSLICVWINGWVNTREAGDLRGYRGHYDVIIMYFYQGRLLLTRINFNLSMDNLTILRRGFNILKQNGICASVYQTITASIMACYLFRAKPFSEPMLTYCQLGHWNKIRWSVYRNYICFIAEYAFQNVVSKTEAILSLPWYAKLMGWQTTIAWIQYKDNKKMISFYI